MLTGSNTILIAVMMLLSGSEWSLPEGGGQFVNFREGRVWGNTGCNRLMGSYEQDGAKIKIGPLATTRKACHDEAAAEKERAFLQMLEATREVDATHLKLILKDAEGEILGVLRRNDWD